MKLIYGSENDGFSVVGYCDASFANETQYHSRSGFGLLGGSLISWYSKKQSVPAHSSAEAEYYAAAKAANEAVWPKKLLNE